MVDQSSSSTQLNETKLLTPREVAARNAFLAHLHGTGDYDKLKHALEAKLLLLDDEFLSKVFSTVQQVVSQQGTVANLTLDALSSVILQTAGNATCSIPDVIQTQIKHKIRKAGSVCNDDDE